MTFQDGIILFKSGDYDAAADHFLQLTKKEKENHKAWNALGTCLSILGKYDDANTCFKNAIQLQPNNETYIKNLTKNELKREKEDDIFSLDDKTTVNTIKSNSKSNFQNSNQFSQNNKNYGTYQKNNLLFVLLLIDFIGILMVFYQIIPFLGLSICLACAGYIKKDADSLNVGNNHKASFLGKLTGLEWGVLTAGFNIISICLYLINREKLFYENYGFPENKKPFLKSLNITKGIIYFLCILFFLGLLFYASLSLDPGNSATLQCSLLALSGNPNEALPICEEACQLDPFNADAWGCKGVVLNSLNRYEEAIVALDKAIELNPNYSKTWGVKGSALFQLNKIEESIEAFDKAIELDPKNPLVWGMKGYSLYALKRYDEAIEVFDKGIDLDPNDKNLWNGKGLTLESMGRIEESNAILEKMKTL